MSYAESFTKHLRLTILRILAEAPEYKANDSILDASASDMGLPCTRDRIRTELVWLEEQGLVRVSRPVDGITVGCITDRGHDVAIGQATNPGVQRPSPQG
jgi:repressor of nif and glnA expression